ncbi:hypothetical protein LTR56_019373 [Elasticomyces elasticus]|nr:hypothetical protein LTR56_019373 [Elasticomyces elasticus]KAK3658615.1 hypothetical protein LTR22_008787 [Elasticomyces elasticus]KAK4911387.1 hypothetical protein LTR49_020038 [Elasticomyces elasticus]
MSDRERSASPAREQKSKKQKTSGGFKWKDKKPRDEDATRDSGRLERGYRDRSPRRDSYRDREQDRGKKEDDRDEQKAAKRLPPPQETDKPAPATDTATIDGSSEKPAEPARRDPFAGYKPRAKAADTPVLPAAAAAASATAPKTKSKKPKAPPAPTGPVIVVNINDRLGTKAAIPCYASDSVKVFKAMVAAHIGRQPHEILIKRQGERPFKDQLSLEDYGVSNGVQLDLELDTGD